MNFNQQEENIYPTNYRPQIDSTLNNNNKTNLRAELSKPTRAYHLKNISQKIN